MSRSWDGPPETTLEAVRRHYRTRGWACWPWPGGGYHARRVDSGEPLSAHGATPGELRVAIERAEKGVRVR